MSTAGFYGDRFEFLAGVQADYATENTSGQHIKLPVRSVRPTRGRETTEATLLGQGKHLPNKTHFGTVSPALEIGVPMEMGTIGYHLTGMFGEATTTAGTPNQHAWNWNENSPDPYFYTLGLEPIDRAGTRAALRYGKAIYNSMSLNLARGSQVMDARFGLLAARVVEGVSTHDATPTVPTLGEELRNFQAFVRLGGDVDTLTTTANVTSFSLNVSRNFSHDQVQMQNSDVSGGFLPGITSITGSIGLRCGSNAQRTLASAMAVIKMAVGLRNPSSSDNLLISTDLCLLDPFDWQVDGVGFLTADVPFRIQQPGVDPPGTGANMLKFQLFNTMADYAEYVPA